MHEILEYYTENQYREIIEKNSKALFVFEGFNRVLMVSHMFPANGATWFILSNEINNKFTVNHDMQIKSTSVKAVPLIALRGMPIYHALAPQCEGNLNGAGVSGTCHVGVRWGRMKSIKDPSMYHWNNINLLKLS